MAAICARGAAAAHKLVRVIENRRAEHDAALRARIHDEHMRDVSSRALEAARAALRRAADPAIRAEQALHAAGGRFLSARRLSDAQLEVRYAFEGERFVTVVAADTLQIIDAGICLSGSDRHAGQPACGGARSAGDRAAGDHQEMSMREVFFLVGAGGEVV